MSGRFAKPYLVSQLRAEYKAAAKNIMPSISNNPYQSPQLDAQNAIDLEAMSDSAGKKRQATISYSAWAGVLFGGIFGLAGSLMLALSRGFLLGWGEFFPTQEVVWIPIMGSTAGVACGLMIGPFVGSMIAYGRSRMMALVTAILLSASAGGLIGQLGTQIVVLGPPNVCPPDAPVTLALIVGISIGGLAGVLGGRQMGRRILAYHD